MQIEVDPKKLREVRLFVATPMYGGNSHGMYTKSCLDLQALCAKHGISVKFSFLFNESLITRGRNYCADEFLRSDCTHLLFIDADICFDPRDVIALLALDKELIGAPYPKKSIKWESIKKAVIKNPDIDPKELAKLGGDYVFNPVHGTTQFNVGEPLEVSELGTGFMMIKREVFDKLKEAFPQLEYKPDHLGQANFDGSRMIHAYFDTVIDTPDGILGDGSMRYLSEDYFFTRLWRKIGGQVWLCPWVKTHHIGSYAFIGDMNAVANHVGNL